MFKAYKVLEKPWTLPSSMDEHKHHFLSNKCTKRKFREITKVWIYYPLSSYTTAEAKKPLQGINPKYYFFC